MKTSLLNKLDKGRSNKYWSPGNDSELKADLNFYKGTSSA